MTQVNLPTADESVAAFLPMRLTAIRWAARGTNLYEFRGLGGGVLPLAEPGSHIGLMLPNGMERQYSLVEAGEGLDRYVVGIKRDPASRGGSAYVHDRLKVGDVIPVAPPRNNFPLAEAAARTVLVAGGIGITPIWCMLNRLEALGRPWTLHYACRSREDAAFLDELEGRAGVHLHFDDEAGAFLDVAAAVSAAPEGAHLYCCGPSPMLKAFEAAAAGRPPGTVHVEYFTARFEAASEGGFVVQLARSGGEHRVEPGKSILHTLREAGLDLPSSCEEGVCGACETRVVAGEPDHRDAILSERERAENKTMFICCSGCKGDRLVLDL